MGLEPWFPKGGPRTSSWGMSVIDCCVINLPQIPQLRTASIDYLVLPPRELGIPARLSSLSQAAVWCRLGLQSHLMSQHGKVLLAAPRCGCGPRQFLTGCSLPGGPVRSAAHSRAAGCPQSRERVRATQEGSHSLGHSAFKVTSPPFAICVS